LEPTDKFVTLWAVTHLPDQLQEEKPACPEGKPAALLFQAARLFLAPCLIMQP